MPGDRLGRIGGRFVVGWARLLGATVIAEVPRANARDFWYASPEVQGKVVDAFRRTGVTALVAEQIPPSEIYPIPPDWVRLDDTWFYVLKVSPPTTK
jgi:hypothetical protein